MRTENQKDGKNQAQNGKNQKNGKNQRELREHRDGRDFRDGKEAAELRDNKREQTDRKKGDKRQAPDSQPKVKIIPLGGLEQIGMNITAFEYEDSILVVDCGLSFPTDDMLGIDLVIPDVTYLEQNLDKVRGFVIKIGRASCRERV